MSILDRLATQTDELENYNNKITNLMSNFDLEKSIYDQTDLAYKGAKQLSGQVFNQQQVENISMAVPAIYGVAKGAYARYKAGKEIPAYVPGEAYPFHIFDWEMPEEDTGGGYFPQKKAKIPT